MSVFLLAVGAVVAGLGTRAAAGPLVAAAVFGARQSDPLLAALTTWTAAMAAAWVLLDRRSPRTASIPMLGAAAVLAAGGSPNGAVVLGLWTLGTVAVIGSRGALASGRRWAIAIAVTDIVFAVAVATTAGRGFEGWPTTLQHGGGVAMIIAAAMRAPLAGGPSGAGVASFATVLVLRAQTVVLVALAATAVDRTLLRTIVVVGIAAFAAAAIGLRRPSVDALQELGLVASVIAAAELGWVTTGWVWGALAAGTLMHVVRFALRAAPAGAVAEAIGRGAGIGLPFLPVCAALVEGVLASSTRLALPVLLGVLGGLAGRARSDVPHRDSQRDLRAWAPVAAAIVASLTAPVLWSPAPPAGGAIPWPPLWGAALVLAVGAIGSQMRRVVPPPPERRDRPASTARRVVQERIALVDAVATDAVLWAAMTAVAAAAVVLWLIGLGRGFL